jgi:putative ABC transport system permease protein
MFSELWIRLRALLGIGAGDRELDDELRFHLDRQIEKHVAAGMPRDEAMRRARTEFGGVEQVKEEYHDVQGVWLTDSIAQYTQEVRHAFRMLAKSPAFTFVAALSLALGIGANSALFSLHDAILLRPLPVSEPGSVVTVTTVGRERGQFSGSMSYPTSSSMSYPNYRDLRDQAQSFEGLVADRLITVSFGRSRQAAREMRMGMLVSSNFFDVLGIQPALGRRFTASEGEVPGRDAVVVLGHDFWNNGLAGDGSILGSTVVLNGVDFTVVGVAPKSFTGTDVLMRPAFYVPLMMAHRLSRTGTTSGNPLEDRTDHGYEIKGRLKSGTTQEAARTELAALWSALQQQYPEANRDRAIAVRTEVQQRLNLQPSVAVQVGIMTGLAALVLIIACANVANLMLGRARARSREIAIRLALGISRTRLLRQLLTESLLLALAGCVLGLAFAYGGIRFLSNVAQTLVPSDVPLVVDLKLNGRVLVFTLLGGLTSAVIFGLAPAWQSLKTELIPALKNAESSQTASRKTVGRNVLVVGQVALSMVLLVAAGMLVDGLRRSESLQPGFRTDHLMIMSLDTALAGRTPAQAHNFYRGLADRARELHGVVSVALTSSIPLGELQRSAVVPEHYELPQGTVNASVLSAVVDPSFFDTMKTEIVRGRRFEAGDKDGSRGVAIVNEEFVRTYWPNQEPIGKRIRLGDNRGPWLEVVGLAKTAKYKSLSEPPTPFLYLPFEQHEQPRMSLLVETADADASPLTAPLRDLVRTLDANQPISDLRTFSSFYRARAISGRLMLMQATSAMGALGLTLALVGLYGLVAYSVARRTREIGIRMAIGASRSDVMRMVVRQGLALSMAGILVGSVLSVVAGRLITAGLVGLGAPSQATYIIIPGVLIVLTMAASYIPARRASRVDPLRALRDD